MMNIRNGIIAIHYMTSKLVGVSHVHPFRRSLTTAARGEPGSGRFASTERGCESAQILDSFAESFYVAAMMEPARVHNDNIWLFNRQQAE